MLDHLLHPVTMARINDSRLYGNDYSLNEMMADLSSAIFADDMALALGSRRAQLQADYVERLLVISDPAAGSGHDPLSRSAALFQLLKLEQELAQRPVPDLDTGVHVTALRHRLKTALHPTAQ